MSQTPTFSQPPEPLTSTPSRIPPPPASAVESTVRRLRAELAASTDRARQARLLAELGDMEERIGDEPAAARDYLASYNADATFREPLEGLVRLLEKRRSLKNLGKLVEALTRAAVTPEEKVRGLVSRAAYQADVAGDLAEAKVSAREATEVEGAPLAEQASAWLSLEVLAGRLGDPATREEALARRAALATHPAWRALLTLDLARMAAAGGHADSSLDLLQQAAQLGSSVTWAATTALEEATRDPVGERADLHATALERMAGLVRDALAEAAQGDALGVPVWMRDPMRLADLWLRAADARRAMGQNDRAAVTLDQARAHLATVEGRDGALALASIVDARIRVAEHVGDTPLAAELAEQRLATEKDPGLVAALALRVAEHASAQEDGPRALEALSRAITSDPGCIPARALQLDMLSDGADAGAFAAQLESFADYLSTDEARGRAFLLAAFVWAVRASDVAGAKAALSQAGMFGVPAGTTARVARALASVVGDAGWYEDATKRLVAAGGDGDVASLCLELARARLARKDEEGVSRAIRDMAAAPGGAWLARALEAYLPAPQPTGAGDGDSPGTAATASVRVSARALAALDELAALETDPDVARGLQLVAASRALESSQEHGEAGETLDAAARLRAVAEREPGDALVASFLGDVERASGDHGAAARTAAVTAAATSDSELAAALHLEAAFEHWRAGERGAAIDEIESAAAGAPDAARMTLAWASRGVLVDAVDGRRLSIERALTHGAGDPRALELERFANEVGGGDPDDALAALQSIERTPLDDLGVAAALARLAWSSGASDAEATREAVARLAGRGPRALLLANAEAFRLAREAGDVDESVRAAQRWFAAGGALPAALEWLGAALVLGQPADEQAAQVAVADGLSGEAREAMLAGAVLLEPRVHPERPAPLLDATSAAVRLANLELSPAGCDPRRRHAALSGLGDALGEDSGVEALSMGGWSALVAGDLPAASAAFERAVAARPDDLSAWEGLRCCGEQGSDRPLRARAAAELGAACADDRRGAAFWEEAALEYLDLGDDARADAALEAGFARDAARPITFDKLFRRLRERKDNDHLLTVMTRRLEVTDDPQEIQKLYWEQARVLRGKGDQDGALAALEHVTMLDPDHVGALALLGEVNIRRGNFEEAAGSLGRLATLEAAPAKNRLTAGVAAVDLYENKLNRFDKALEVLLVLHRAKLTNLPVRERLARAAARTGSWRDATGILEELMHERQEPEGRIEAARLAMAIHRDRLGDAQGAAAAIERLLEEAPTDGEALDMLLQTEHPAEVRKRLLVAARSTLIETLRERPTDLPSVRRLVKVARALGDDGLQQAALGVLLALSSTDAGTENAFAQLAARKARAPQIAIERDMMASILAPGDAGPLADLFMLLGPTLAEAFGPSLQACGVGRRDKVDPRSGLGLRNEIAAWAGAFGIKEFDLYVGGKDPLAVQGIPGELPALVVGAGVNAPLAPLTRARVARELLAVVRGSVVARARDDITVAAIVVAACTQGEVRIDHPPYAVLAEVERLLGKAIARKTRKLLPEVCRAIVTAKADARAWSRAAVASQDRVAIIASGDPSVVVADVLGVALEKLPQAVKGSARAEELLRFALSPQYLDIRRALGLEASA